LAFEFPDPVPPGVPAELPTFADDEGLGVDFPSEAGFESPEGLLAVAFLLSDIRIRTTIATTIEISPTIPLPIRTITLVELLLFFFRRGLGRS
jgi:hypothetical protein